MSMQSLQAFRNRVNASEPLQAEMRACGTDVGAMTDLGRKHGYDFTAEEIRAVFIGAAGELTDFELEMVNAGNNGTDRFDRRAGSY